MNIKINFHWLEGDYLEGCGQDLLHGTRPVFALENSDNPGVPKDTTSCKWTEIPVWTFLIHLQTVDLAGWSLARSHTKWMPTTVWTGQHKSILCLGEPNISKCDIAILCPPVVLIFIFLKAEARFPSQVCPRRFWYRWSATVPGISPSQYIILTINSVVK
jgi:hypothetical protein